MGGSGFSFGGNLGGSGAKGPVAAADTGASVGVGGKALPKTPAKAAGEGGSGFEKKKLGFDLEKNASPARTGFGGGGGGGGGGGVGGVGGAGGVGFNKGGAAGGAVIGGSFGAKPAAGGGFVNKGGAAGGGGFSAKPAGGGGFGFNKKASPARMNFSGGGFGAKPAAQGGGFAPIPSDRGIATAESLAALEAHNAALVRQLAEAEAENRALRAQVKALTMTTTTTNTAMGAQVEAGPAPGSGTQGAAGGGGGVGLSGSLAPQRTNVLVRHQRGWECVFRWD